MNSYYFALLGFVLLLALLFISNSDHPAAAQSSSKEVQ